jgi:hypothetical protein
MVPHLFFYRFALITLVWRFFLLFMLGRVIVPRRKCSTTPAPFAGLP